MSTERWHYLTLRKRFKAKLFHSKVMKNYGYLSMDDPP
jgi:hypothetical protein